MTRKNSTPTPTPAVTGPAHRADGRQALRGPALALTGDVLPVGTLAGDDVSSAVAQAWLAYTGERFAPTSLVKWVRLSYVMIRGDHGKAQPRASVAALDGTPLGTPWLTVCHHGTALRVPYGNQAEDAGRQRTAWCKACEAGRPATIPGLPGAVPVPAPAPRRRPPGRPPPGRPPRRRPRPPRPRPPPPPRRPPRPPPRRPPPPPDPPRLTGPPPLPGGGPVPFPGPGALPPLAGPGPRRARGAPVPLAGRAPSRPLVPP